MLADFIRIVNLIPQDGPFFVLALRGMRTGCKENFYVFTRNSNVMHDGEKPRQKHLCLAAAGFIRYENE